MKASKEEFIAASEAKLADMQQQHAENKKALFDAKEDLELTRKQRSADVEFLRNLKLTCNDLDKQFEERTKMRTEEIKAVSEALAILTSDESRDLMSKTVTLLQLQEKSQTTMEMRMRRTRAANVLQTALAQPAFDDLLDAWNGRHGPDSPRHQLAMLSVNIQLDAFTKVKEAMDQMVQELKDQQLEEA